MKIALTGKKGSGLFSFHSAKVRASGDQELLVDLLERALEIARTQSYDADIRELFQKKPSK